MGTISTRTAPLRRAAISAMCFATILSAKDIPTPPAVPFSRVFYALDTTVLDASRSPDSGTVRRMVESLVLALTAKPDITSAWRSMVKPQDVVGIKVSTSAGPVGGTKPAIVNAVARGLRTAGISRDHILVWDRNRSDLLAAGFREDSPDYTLRWIDPASGYDKKAQISAPVLGRLIYGDRAFGDRKGARFADLLANGDQLSIQSHYSKILVRDVTKIIHIPSSTDSFLTGVHGAIADMTLSNIDNWRRFTKPPDFGDPYLAEIYSDETIRPKILFTLLDALILQYAGGPYPHPNFTVDNSALFASKDPVAIDATLLAMLEEVRKNAKLPPLSPMAHYIASAAALGLGENTSSRVETVRVGVQGLR